MKYIIDVPNQDYSYDKMLHTLKLKFYDDNLSCEVILDAEPYTEPDRKAIEDEVWELADYMCKMSSTERTLCFAFEYPSEVTTNFTFQEAKSKFEAWLKQKDEIHVGDEVIPIDVNYDTMIVTRIWMDDHSRDCLDTLGLDGSICSFLTSNVKKTGRHFPEVAELLEKMRGKQNE